VVNVITGFAGFKLLSEPRSNLLVNHWYKLVHFAFLFVIENRHFCFRARNHVIATVVGQIVTSLA